MDMSDDEAVLTRVVTTEDSGVVNRLGHALHRDEVFVVCGFPYAASVGASSHVSGDLDVVGGAVVGMCGKGAIVDVDSVLESGRLDGELGDKSGG